MPKSASAHMAPLADDLHACCAQALGAALDANEAIRTREAQSNHGAEVVAALKVAIAEVRAGAAPAAQVPEGEKVAACCCQLLSHAAQR
jgi:hypothetical protein